MFLFNQSVPSFVKFSCFPTHALQLCSGLHTQLQFKSLFLCRSGHLVFDSRGLKICRYLETYFRGFQCYLKSFSYTCAQFSFYLSIKYFQPISSSVHNVLDQHKIGAIPYCLKFACALLTITKNRDIWRKTEWDYQTNYVCNASMSCQNKSHKSYWSSRHF